MRQTTMDRWIEAAEANRFCQIAQQTSARSTEPPLINSLLTRLRSMVRPETSHPSTVHAAVIRSSASA
jgi:hypothetical protein